MLAVTLKHRERPNADTFKVPTVGHNWTSRFIIQRKDYQVGFSVDWHLALQSRGGVPVATVDPYSPSPETPPRNRAV